VCADVTSLYPSIPIPYGLKQVREFLLLHKTAVNNVNIELIMELLEWVLTNNYFEFNNIVYKQLTGTAMGTPVANIYANIVLFMLERDCLKFSPVLYLRYLDDLFIIVNAMQHGKNIIEVFNNQCPTIKLEAVTYGTSGVFLDLFVSIENNQLITTVYQKPINKYLYLTPSSAHQFKVFYNLIKQELRRYKMICSRHEDYLNIANTFKSRLLSRNHNSKLIDTIINEVNNEQITITTNNNSNTKPQKSTKPILTINQATSVAVRQSGYSIAEICNLDYNITESTEYKHIYGSNTTPTIGKFNDSSIAKYVVRAKFEYDSSTQTNK
jgi:hypothetical protein